MRTIRLSGMLTFYGEGREPFEDTTIDELERRVRELEGCECVDLRLVVARDGTWNIVDEGDTVVAENVS